MKNGRRILWATPVNKSKPRELKALVVQRALRFTGDPLETAGKKVAFSLPIPSGYLYGVTDEWNTHDGDWCTPLGRGKTSVHYSDECAHILSCEEWVKVIGEVLDLQQQGQFLLLVTDIPEGERPGLNVGAIEKVTREKVDVNFLQDLSVNTLYIIE